MIETVLVANRGEIALRIIRACQELGVRAVAVYSEADSGSPHAWAADVAVEIGPPAAAESYLSVEKLLDVARTHGADAIHPGYGFLSEKPDFVEAVHSAGLTFIGPPPEAMRALGDKSEARRLAQASDVPVVPGSHALDDPADLATAAREIGLPVLLKAAAGGGGKGMRLIQSDDELADAIPSAQREAQGAFGDGRLFIEKAVHPARHVEVQIIGDHHGNVIALGERECSLQRRHQKIIEEAPSPVVDGDLRERLQASARALAEASGYHNAGTVEFLLGPDGSFYFLEVNTRLQVEHPVTELVTGLDLVQLQLQVAGGSPLPITQDEVTIRGHAIEARLYAEDPDHDFLPQTGEILQLRWPERPGLRIDAGVVEGQAVHAHYDPMLAKLIACGPDRERARQRLIESLEEAVLLGVVTNQAYLIELLESDFFIDAETYTHTVESTERNERPLPMELLLAAALAEGRPTMGATDGTASSGGDPYSPWRRLGNWRGAA